MDNVCEEASKIRDAMARLEWEYLGGGPYPENPTLNFRRGNQIVRVTIGKIERVGPK